MVEGSWDVRGLTRDGGASTDVEKNNQSHSGSSWCRKLEKVGFNSRIWTGSDFWSLWLQWRIELQELLEKDGMATREAVTGVWARFGDHWWWFKGFSDEVWVSNLQLKARFCFRNRSWSLSRSRVGGRRSWLGDGGDGSGRSPAACTCAPEGPCTRVEWGWRYPFSVLFKVCA